MTPEYIDTHDSVYNCLVQYFLPELSEPYFRQDAAQEIEQDERMTYCRYMAAWLSHEPHYEEILKMLTMNEAGAIKDSARFSAFYVICPGMRVIYIGSAELPGT